MTKNVLFLVAGMTPQIITETLWALACDPENAEQWVPDEIHVMSTGDGLKKIREHLFDKGNFKKLLDDYQLEHVHFDEKCLYAIQNQDRENLNDLKTLEDSQRAGNAICRKIRELTQDEDVNLHVSIAGGRKTMGFYAGYALSLYGRWQDSMSHVLVDERFESILDFYYPTPGDYFVEDRNGKKWNAKEATVWLANIEFVRMKEAIKEKHQLNSQDSFIQVVEKINASFKDIKLMLLVHSNTVVVKDTFTISDLSPAEFATLHWFADNRKRGKGGIVAPKENINWGKKNAAQEYIRALTDEFYYYYEYAKTSRSAEETGLVMDKKCFESTKSRLQTKLAMHLGLELSAKFAIKQQGKRQPFYLDLDPDCIEIVDNFKQ